MEFQFNKDITYFAKTNFRGTDQIFGIKRRDRRQHMYLLGKSGTGKSVTLENMIIQNIHQGEGVCVVDPHGELVEKILETIPPERIKDVIYFNPADTDFNIGFNVLQLDDPRYKHLVASGLMGIFTKIWANAWSSRMEYILNNNSGANSIDCHQNKMVMSKKVCYYFYVLLSKKTSKHKCLFLFFCLPTGTNSGS